MCNAKSFINIYFSYGICKFLCKIVKVSFHLWIGSRGNLIVLKITEVVLIATMCDVALSLKKFFFVSIIKNRKFCTLKICDEISYF